MRLTPTGAIATTALNDPAKCRPRDAHALQNAAKANTQANVIMIQ
jgi:hypothetical protein